MRLCLYLGELRITLEEKIQRKKWLYVNTTRRKVAEEVDKDIGEDRGDGEVDQDRGNEGDGRDKGDGCK